MLYEEVENGAAVNVMGIFALVLSSSCCDQNCHRILNY